MLCTDAMPTTPFSRIAYDEAAAAELCSVGVSEIRRWVKEGRLVAHYSGERASKPLYRPADLDDAVSGLPTTKGVA